MTHTTFRERTVLNCEPELIEINTMADDVADASALAPSLRRSADALSDASNAPAVDQLATAAATAPSTSSAASNDTNDTHNSARTNPDASLHDAILRSTATTDDAASAAASASAPLRLALTTTQPSASSIVTTAYADLSIDPSRPTDNNTNDDDDNNAETQRARELRAREMELFESQLEKEMLKRRPDHFIIGVICRSLGGVPDRMRSSVWKELLGVTRSERVLLDQSILKVEEDLANQRVISADACRTRGHDPYFRQPETIELITKLLTYYCKCRNIRYKQGMNEVLAPFLILERAPPLPEGVVFQCFYALIDKFLPHVFVDREFKSLQCSFQLYRLLMLYHDPMLCHYLDQHDMTPELYVTPWFMTLFARNLEPDLVFRLWDFFLLQQEHPYLLHFVAYALVAAHKQAILATDVTELPRVLTSIAFRSVAELEAICDAALQLAQTTPRSFERDLYAVCYGGYSDSSLPFVRHVAGATSLQVYPDELVANLLQRISAKSSTLARESVHESSESLNPLLSPLARSSSFSTERNASAASVFFIVLDCRPIEQYRACHLSLSYHIDPEVVASPDALMVLINGFSRMKGCHFCFVGPSDPATATGPKPSNIAFDTISRLARGISGERKTHSDGSMASGGGKLSPSPSVPGASDSKESDRKIYNEHISVTRLVLMFLQKGFEHISRLDGGFDELKAAILAMDAFTQEQLLVHAEPQAPSSAATSSAGAAAPATGFKLFSKIGLTRLRSAHSEDNIVVTSADASAQTEPPPPLPPVSAPSVLATTTDASTRLKPKTATFSQRFQSFTTAVSQGATAVVRSRSVSEIAQAAAAAASHERSSDCDDDHVMTTDERQLVGEDEWVEVCLRTKEALEKSLAYKEVVFQAGSMGILLQKAKTSRTYHAMVDSIVPESQASESQQMERGDLLVSVNGQSMANVPFLCVVELVKDAARPVVLCFQNPNAKRALESFDALAMPPTAPTLVSATHHAIGIAWRKLALPNVQYQLQYARQSEFHFNPWLTVTMKRDESDSSALSTSGVTAHTNGTMVGLEPSQSFVFRVRCGDGDKWGPYSLSSHPIRTLERRDSSSVDDREGPQDDQAVSDQSSLTEPVFLPGSCPVVIEHGLFYYRVAISLWARRRPAFDAEKLDTVFEKGSVLKCVERMIAPGTNQIFVRVATDDDVSTTGTDADSSSAQDRDDAALATTGNDGDDDDDEDNEVGVWAFENTAEGTVVLERLSEPPVDETPSPAPPSSSSSSTATASSVLLPLQEQAKSVVSSIFSSGSKSSPPVSATTATTSSSATSPHPNDDDVDAVSSSAAARVVAAPVAPKILQVFPVSSTAIVVTWDPINDVGVTKYQIQCSRNRLAAMWWSVSHDVDAETLKYTVEELLPNTAYLFRIRGHSDDAGWGPYSDASESCRTLLVDESVKDAAVAESAAASTAAADDKSEAQTSAGSAPGSRTSSGNGFRLPVGSIFSVPSAASATASSSTAPSSTPLRTGSTFLDKAVAAASRLTLTRRRSHSSTSITSSSNAPVTLSTNAEEHESGEQETPDGHGSDDSDERDQMVEDAGGVTHVNLGHWKKDATGAFQDFRFFTATQYKRRPSGNSSSSGGEDTTDASTGAADPVATSRATEFIRVGDRDLVVTPASLFVLNAWASKREGYAVLEHSRMLESLVKITAQKAVKNLIVLHFKVRLCS